MVEDTSIEFRKDSSGLVRLLCKYKATDIAKVI